MELADRERRNAVDRKVAEHEHYLTRKISNLLELEPGYLSAAKDAARKRA